MLRTLGMLVTAALVAAAPAAAQTEPKVQVTVGGGWTGVYGAAADHIGNGGNFTFGLLYHINDTIGIQGEYGWNGMKKKELDLPVYPTPFITGGSNQPFFADASMQYGAGNLIVSPHVSGKTAPYFITGLGFYHRPVDITTPSVGYTTICDPYWYVCYNDLVAVDQVVGSRSSNDFGMNFGGGVNFKMTDHTSIYFEVRYHYIWGPTLNQVNPLSTGSSSSSTKANGQFLPITVGFRF
ncbi:MAG TPA: outer membrane beta-barrel protein [Vicinamibacterales bacterium]|jgi:opacity protein-like surface antigen|nr:outer membrane beta-barrel protein [Vicinamibacterales bacterium]